MTKKKSLLKKSPFLLLEVLLCLCLFGMSLQILFFNPLRILKKELSSLEKLKMQNAANLSFAVVKQNLYKNQIPWESLNNDGKNKVSWTDSEIEEIEKKLGLPYALKIELCTPSGNQEEDTAYTKDLLLLQIEIGFISKKEKRNKLHKNKGDITFTYNVLATKTKEKNTLSSEIHAQKNS